MDLSAFPHDLTLYGVSLQCAKTGCESRVLLLALVKREIPEDELSTHMQTNWRNHSALCANDHRPIYPLQIGRNFASQELFAVRRGTEPSKALPRTEERLGPASPSKLTAHYTPVFAICNTYGAWLGT